MAAARPISADPRNTRVLMLLVFAMSLGAGILFLLEGSVRWPGGQPLTAVAAARPRAVESVEIAYVRAGPSLNLGAFDYVIYPAGWPEHLHVSESVDSRVRLAVVGVGSPRLDESQQANLLNVLGTLRKARGFSLAKVALSADSDPRRVADLPADARHLYALLVGRGIIR
jgi:hypothetical protein